MPASAVPTAHLGRVSAVVASALHHDGDAPVTVLAKVQNMHPDVLVDSWVLEA